ncbi:MAG: hypothetical protein GQ474_05945 [Sulfurimonas sp.]|nr:hypothetical protein [Sulfurimonas sp.]
MAKIDSNSIGQALSTTWSKTQINALLKKKRLNNTDYAMLFSFYNYSQTLVTNTLHRDFGKSHDTAGRATSMFIKKCAEVGINVADYIASQAEPQPKKPRPKKAKRGEIEKAVQKFKPILNFFNVHTKTTLELLQSLDDKDAMSTEALIASYKVLYTLLMAKATGEVVTTKTSTKMKLEEDDDGAWQEVITKNDKGERTFYKETQSYLPDERAFAGALVVLEVIDTLQSGNKEFLTQEEQENRYGSYLKEITTQRTNFENKEYTEAELVK